MKRTIALAAVALVLNGCAFIEGTRYVDGTMTVRSSRLLWASEGIDFGVTDTNGFTTHLKVERSNPDAQAIGAVAEGAARGAVQGAK